MESEKERWGRGKGPSVVVQFRLRPWELRSLDALAKRWSASRSEVVRQALAMHGVEAARGYVTDCELEQREAGYVEGEKFTERLVVRLKPDELAAAQARAKQWVDRGELSRYLAGAVTALWHREAAER